MEKEFKDFAHFLVNTPAVKFGNFLLKNGTKSEIFFDMGKIYYGENLNILGNYYSDFIVNNSLHNIDVLFGPAYKGINIAITTSISLWKKHNIQIPFSYNRKTEKNHGEKGNFIGYNLSKAKTVLIIDDVFTDGGTKYETIKMFSSFKNILIKGIVIGVDREETDKTEKSYVSIFENKTRIKVYSLTKKSNILLYK